jgi:exopolyphosphatase/guanosine-5'-triphosphate,3'-diphosphate pyrophosphatase
VRTECRLGGTTTLDRRVSVSASSEEGTATVAHEPIEPPHGRRRTGQRVYAALDLGTNNCRLLIAEPRRHGFRVVDAFSRIVRLGEGIAHTGRISEPAMDRAVEALKICRRKLAERSVSRARLIATEACRAAVNGSEFLARVKDEADLDLEIVSRETEARLAVTGCAGLVDLAGDGAILFDIGGGSSELVWIDLSGASAHRGVDRAIRAWASLPVGVVTLAERFGGHEVDATLFEAMVADVAARIDAFRGVADVDRAAAGGRVHLLGTSGTVTTLAGVHLGLERYDRRRVDGLWLASADVDAMVARIRAMSHAERVASPCIGHDRADLVIAGCAILEAIRRRWPCERLRVADRGLREGILSELIAADRYDGYGERDGWS